MTQLSYKFPRPCPRWPDASQLEKPGCAGGHVAVFLSAQEDFRAPGTWAPGPFQELLSCGTTKVFLCSWLQLSLHMPLLWGLENEKSQGSFFCKQNRA